MTHSASGNRGITEPHLCIGEFFTEPNSPALGLGSLCLTHIHNFIFIIQMSTKISKNVVNTGQYRKCFNHQILEMLSTLSTISATVVDKEFSGDEYRICSVDGNTHTIKLFTNKLWDLILLKLTEVVHYDTRRKKPDWYRESDWYKDNDDGDDWYIVFSIKTIAECLNVSTDDDSLAHLYDRIVAAIKVLQNISITVTDKMRRKCKIDGYLDDVGVRDGSYIEGRITKANACFALFINPQLIAYLATQRVGLYHFNHAWLHLTGNCQNAYAAAKRMGRLYSQNTHYRRIAENVGITTTIGTLRAHLPSLNSKVERENRMALENAMNAIPGLIYNYGNGDTRPTFEELTKLRLRGGKYDTVKIIVKFFQHPNTSENDVTDESIGNMNDDALLLKGQFYRLEEADGLINHKGVLKRPVKKLEPSSDEDGTELRDADETATENPATDNYR
jgi:hypothetical protein